MAWRIEKQANGKYAIWSSRARDYVVIDADRERIEAIYADKGAKVYLASARAQLAKDAPVPDEGEALIAASRERGGPPRDPADERIGATGYTLEDLE